MGNFSQKEKYLKFCIYIIVIVLINIVGITLFFRIDLTRDKIYSLSDASRNVVETLSEPLTIKVFFSKNLPAPHNNTERYLRDLLEEYAARGPKFFNYSFYDVTPDEGTSTKTADENRKMAEDYGIQPVQIQIMENDEIKFKNAYMGLVIINGDLVERFGAITSTNNLEYYLTTAIQKMNSKVSALLNLKEKVHVDMYLSSSLNTIAPLIGLNQLPSLGKKIQETIDELNHKSLGVIEFNHIDISDRQQLKELEKKYAITPLTWPDFPQEQIAAGQGAAEIVIRFKDQTTTLPLISSAKHPVFQVVTYQMADPAELEEQINSVIEKLIGINMEIGFLAGFGAHSLVPDQMAMMQGQPAGGMQNLNALISKRYTIKPIDLKDFTIPDGMSCLMITRPTQKFSDYELFQIDQALMKGTNIAYITDAFNETASQQSAMGMPQQFKPINTGLEKLFKHYGVEIQKAYVMDKQAYIHRDPRDNSFKEQILYFVPHLKEDSINHTPTFMNNIKELYAMQIAPIDLIPENINKEKVAVTKLLSSSKESWLMKGMINLSPQYISPPTETDQMKSYDLAYLLSGEFTSYFKGKPIPQKEVAEDELDEKEEAPKAIQENKILENKILETSKPAKIFVLSSSQMLQDNMLDPQGQTTNTTFILNVIDHLNGKDDIALLRSKQQQYNPIAETTPFLKNIIKTFNIIGLPVLVIFFGLGVLAKRTSRKKKIANRFKA